MYVGDRDTERRGRVVQPSTVVLACVLDAHNVGMLFRVNTPLFCRAYDPERPSLAAHRIATDLRLKQTFHMHVLVMPQDF